MTVFAAIERAGLADLLEEIGPDAPTLCAGWTTRDLAAHLVVRARRLDAAAGILIPWLAPYTKRVQDRVAAGAWLPLVDQVRRRPPWAVVGDEALNLVEYFVHHEDVRRAQEGWEPRQIPPELSAKLWSRLRQMARFVLRRTPAAVRVSAAGEGVREASVTAGRGGPAVTLRGTPQELLMFLTGRQAHARVELTGPPEITERMMRARYGM